MNKKFLYPLFISALIYFSPCQANTGGAFSIGLIGDLPYAQIEEQGLLNLLQQMNTQPLSLVIHDGDIKNGESPCSDELYKQRKALFASSVHPFIYIPGDNDWTDCHRPNNGNFDPVERLRRLREIFFFDKYSLGQKKLELLRQSDDPQSDSQHYPYRENVRWIYNNIMFVGLNMPGGNNNYGRTKKMDDEFKKRSAANHAWLNQAFRIARKQNLAGVVIVIQANPKFNGAMVKNSRDGYRRFRNQLLQEAIAFAKPILLVHGDTHHFRVDQPLYNGKTFKLIKNFTRVETFGHPEVNWVKVTINPDDPKLFQIEAGNK